MRVLVTGGCGFIGANLVRRLLARGHGVRVVDDLRTGRRAHLEGLDAELVIGDAGDPLCLEPALEGVDAAVHLAAQSGVMPSIEDPRRDFETNAAGTFSALESCRRLGVGRFVFASSGAALGNVPTPLNEERVPRPASPYGASKLAGEAYCRAFSESFGMHTVALRFSNVYGPFSAHKNNAVPNFIKAALTGEPVTVFGDGSQSRDFIYVEDLCEAIELALEAEGVSGEVFQLASGVETTVLELVREVGAAVGADLEVRFAPARRGEVHKSSVDISRARAELGFSPRVSLSAGLARTAEWYRRHWLPRRSPTA